MFFHALTQCQREALEVPSYATEVWARTSHVHYHYSSFSTASQLTQRVAHSRHVESNILPVSRGLCARRGAGLVLIPESLDVFVTSLSKQWLIIDNELANGTILPPVLGHNLTRVYLVTRLGLACILILPQ